MTVRVAFRRFEIGTPLLLLFSLLGCFVFSPRISAADEPSRIAKSPSKPTIPQLRAAADAAEKAGDWEAAFTAYCHLLVADRGSSDVREKLNIALRRTQQLRRHRDPQFQQFVSTTSISDALNLFAEVMTKVPNIYVERERATPQLLWASGIEELNRALGNTTFRQLFVDSSPTVEHRKHLEAFRQELRAWARQPIPDARVARTMLRKLVTTAQDSFDIRNPAAVVLEMVCGACGGLDEYTIFLNPSQAAADPLGAIPDLTSQGLYLGFTDGGLVIAGIAQGSWATHHTSLRKGDRIVRLNGRSMDMATPAATAEALRAAVEGVHVLEIAPPMPEDIPVVVRLPITVPTVYGTGVLNPKDGVGYTRIGSFTATTPRELDAAINTLKLQHGVRVLILDLRGNMGGSFLASVDTARRLLPNGLIVTTQGQLSEVANQPFSSDSGMSAQDIPVVVLIDAETASAAEVLAAALKDNNRATLIGMPTFGKGAIQYPLKLVALDELDEHGKPRTHRSGAVRLTIARLIAPRGAPINGLGISPHIMEADPTRQLELAQEKALELVPSSPRPMIPTLPMIP
jgi:C-terminal peptidase prc